MNNVPKLRFCQWDITSHCNLRCKHCRNVFETFHFDQELTDKILSQIITSGIVKCVLAGGEPTVHPMFEYIVRYLFEKGLKIEVLTNGTLITESLATLFRECECKIQISIDGDGEISHDLIRGDGSFQKMLRGIEILRGQGISFSTRFTITPENKECVPGFVSLSKQLGASHAGIRRCISVGSGSALKPLSAEGLKKAYSVAFSSGENNGIEIRANDRFVQLHFAKDVKLDDNVGESSSISGGCPIGWSSMYIKWDGSVVFCPYLPVHCGDLKEQNILDVWQHSKMYHISRNLRWNIKGKCSKCKYLMTCGGCPAASYCLTGNILDSDPQCWIHG